MSTLPARHAEHITATVVFADVIGFSRMSAEVGSEAGYLAVTQLLRLLGGIARKHGGSVDTYLGDKLMAVFGYPVPVEHAASAACDAALEMRQQVLDYNREAELAIPLGIHMGVNTGEIVGGDIRGPVVREFHVLGDAVNVAARLNAKAPDGDVWVGPRTYEKAREDFQWDVLEPLRLKGKSRPVPAYALRATAVGRSAGGQLGFDARIFPELFGRDDVLLRLRARLGDLAAGGRGGAVLLEGAEGSGKSRLLAALGESQELDRLEVRQVRASTLERDRRGSVFAELAADSGGPLPDSVRDALLSIAARRPLLLVVEDVQWLDASSADALDALLEAVADASILLVMTGRPGPATKRLAEHAEVFPLGELAPEDARSLVEAALGPAADEETIGLVLERGGALPGPLLLAAFLAPALRSEREQLESRVERTSEAERRRAAVVFADLTGFTAMTEQVGAQDAYPVVAACLQILDDVAREHGGTVDHYLGDCVMALFGVPHAIEDAPRAALNAAIDMRRRIRAFNDAHDLAVPVDVHTGVATGLGIAGDISGPLIREFAVMGDHVDRADELTHAAEAGQIFVDEATQRATRDVFEFAEQAPLELPGSEGPGPVWDLRSTAPQLHRARLGAGRQVFSALVGREEQLGTLREGIARVAAGEGGVISLSAEAGIGKSRLLAELRSSEEAQAITWLEGHSLSNGRNLSYHPIAGLLRSAAGVGDEDDAVQARGKLDELAALLPNDASDAPMLLAQLMGAQLTENERQRLDAIQGDAAEKLLRGAVLQLLRAASAVRPLVIVMEDFHWADLSSVELLESLLRLSESSPILFVNAFRPDFEETSGRVCQFARKHLADRHTEVTLAPLDDAAARSMVKNLFRGGDVPQTTRAAIEERARGNPFYIEEVVRTLVDAGAVEIHDGAFRATARLKTVTIPDTVQEAVMARVDRLDLKRRSVLQAASVIGGTFHVEVLDAVLGEVPLASLLADLEAGEFIVPSDRTAGEEYAFKHPLIQEVTYDALLQTNRRELHLSVANATEERLDDSHPGFAAMLAYHFGMGRDPERAEHYLFRAGDEASRSAASNEALQFFQQASKLYDELHPEGGDVTKRARLEKSLAIALMNRGLLTEAVEHFDRTTEYLGSSAPRGTVRMGASFAKNLSIVLAKLYLGRPTGTRPATDRDRELIDVMFRRALAQSTTNPMRFFVDSTALVRSVSRLDPHSVPESAAIYSGIIGIFSFGGISFDIGRRFLDVARELAEAGDVDERVLYCRTLRFLHNLLAGDWSEQHSVELEAIDEGLREGRFWEASTCLDLDAHRLIYQGNFDAAWERIHKLAEIEDLYEHHLANSARLFHTALVHVERREFDAALRALEAYYDEHSEVAFNILAMGTRARVSALRGDLDTAEQEIQRAQALEAKEGRVPPFHASAVRSSRYLVDVLALERAVQGDTRIRRPSARRLRSSRRAALGTAKRVAWRRTEVLRLAGREAWLSGRLEQAHDWWARAVECAEALGARPELARTFADAGRALSGEDATRDFLGRDAAACIKEARQLFSELDLQADLAGLSDAAA